MLQLQPVGELDRSPHEYWKRLPVMLLKRRTPPTYLEYLRISVWPRRSWMRSGQYVTKRVLRLTATPHAIAAGVAAGTLTSFTPLYGLHFIVAAFVAWLIRGNIIASALGTFVGNPLTFPFMIAASWEVGQFLVGSGAASDESPAVIETVGRIFSELFSGNLPGAGSAVADAWWPLLYPLSVGGLFIGTIAAVPMYFIMRRAAQMFRESRRNKLMQKARALRDKARDLAEQRKSGAQMDGAG